MPCSWWKVSFILRSDYRCILARATSLIDGKTDVIIDVSDYGCEEEEVF